MKKRWILFLTLAWPAAHFLLFLVRFRRLPPLVELLYFAPTGILAAFTLHLLVSRSRSAGQTASVVLGAALMAPLALVGNLLGGLFGLVGVTLYGIAPISAGAVLGWLFGKRFRPRDQPRRW